LSVLQSRLDEIYSLTKTLLKQNVVSKKDLRSYEVNAQSVAGVKKQYPGSLVRFIAWGTHCNVVKPIVIGVDATPSGLGGWLAIDKTVVEYFADDLYDVDFAHVGLLRKSDSTVQQFAEALSLLAMRMWYDKWCHRRVNLIIRGDNVAALTMMIREQPKSRVPKPIAREFALDMSQSLS